MSRARMKRVGRRLRGLRAGCGVMQWELATQLGISQTRLSNWETGLRAVPVEAALRLRAIYGIDLNELYA